MNPPPITADQRRKLFATARDHGLSTDDLRAMTPAGSISMLTVSDAATLIDALDRGISPNYGTRAPVRRRRRPKNVYALISREQYDMLLALRIDLQWSEEHLTEWLAKRRFPDRRPMTDMQSSRDAVHVIELLKAVRTKTTAARERRDSV